MASILIAGSAVTITVVLDRATGWVRVERRGWFGRSELTEALSAVEDAVVEESEVDSDRVFRLALRLRDARMFPLTWYFDHDAETKRNAVAAIREFLGRINNDVGSAVPSSPTT